MDLHSQQKTLELERGLFLIKYESTDDDRNPPVVKVSADQGSENSIEVILAPDADDAILWSPGAGLVVRAAGSARLSVIVMAAKPNGSTAARVQVVTLSQDPGGAKERKQTGPLDLSNFRVLGHVAGRGDVIVDADNWIAGPFAPSRIEGFAIQWPDKKPDLTLRYAVTVGGPRPTMGPFVDVGNFTGTRGRALPVVGATLELAGSATNGQQLVVDSIFLGSPQMRVVGQRVVLSGPTGREPLVGLRVRIDPVDQPMAMRPAAGGAIYPHSGEIAERLPPQQPAVVAAVERGSREQNATSGASTSSAKPADRVRVFRSQNRKQAAASPAAS